MTDHTHTPPDDEDSKDPLNVFIDAIRAGYEDLRSSYCHAGGSGVTVHAHPSTLKRITHETDEFLDYRGDIADPTVAAVEGHLSPGMAVVESLAIPDGFVVVANSAHTHMTGGVSVERLKDHR